MLGRKTWYGHKWKLQPCINNFSQQQISELEKDGAAVELELNAGNLTYWQTEVEIIAEDIPGWSVASKGNLTVALDIIHFLMN